MILWIEKLLDFELNWRKGRIWDNFFYSYLPGQVFSVDEKKNFHKNKTNLIIVINCF